MTMKFLSKLFKNRHKPDVVQFVESHYCAVINDKMNCFDSKSDMIKGIEEYSKFNVIYSLNMFRYDLYNLMK